MADAIQINLEAGEILYGASTISMQLVKMLYLDADRVFARKLQELMLVYLMENQVPVSKDRILELYLNLAEFGPGIYGIAQAAEVFFGVTPDALGAIESTWLASVLPAPKVYAAEAEEGEVSSSRMARVNQLYDIMLERGRMNAGEHAAAYGQQPSFAPTDTGV
jgi:membrane peptidoglycan carboxypeptidase